MSKRKFPVAINEEEFTKLIKGTMKFHHKVAFLLGYGGGLRVSEVVNLQPEEIDVVHKKILIKQGKGGKDRIVPLPKGFKENMLKVLPIKCGARSLQRAFKSAARRSGITDIKPTIRFHSLRHGFATRLVSQGVPIHHIRTLMGHANISTTSIYLEANPKEALKSYEEHF